MMATTLRTVPTVLLLLLLLASVGCKEEVSPWQEITPGLAYVDLKRGEGMSAWDGDTVKVLYTGWLKDGSVFDSSRDRGEPATFALNAVVKCFNEGLQMMKVGGKGLYHARCPRRGCARAARSQSCRAPRWRQAWRRG